MFEKAKLQIIDGLNESIEAWCSKNVYDKNSFNKGNQI